MNWWKRKYFLPFIMIHVIWVSLHVLVNSTGLINAWEFGGYGMYTTVPTDVNAHIVLVRPEENENPYLPSLHNLRWWVEAGGCLFGFTERHRQAIVADLTELDLDEVMILFEKFDFADKKDSLQFVGMVRLHAKMLQVWLEKNGNEYSSCNSIQIEVYNPALKSEFGKGYQIKHNFDHGHQNLSHIFAYLAFFLDQIVQHCCGMAQRAHEHHPIKKDLWEAMRWTVGKRFTGGYMRNEGGLTWPTCWPNLSRSPCVECVHFRFFMLPKIANIRWG